MVGRHRLEQRRLCDQSPAAHRRQHLVARQRVEVTVDGLDVDAQVRTGLCTVHYRHGPGRVGQLGELRGGVHGPQRVRDIRECNDLGLRFQRAPKVGQVDPPVLRDLDHPERGTSFLTQDLPRHDVRVVIHRRHDDGIAALHIGPPPRGRHEVDGLRGAPRKHDAFARPGIHEPGDGRTGGFVRFRRLDRQGIRAPVHVGVVKAVVVDDRVDDSSRLLTGRRVIEIHEPLPILLLLQNREVGSDPGGVEHQKSRADSVVTGWALFCSAACSACQARLAHLIRLGKARTPENTASLPGALVPPASMSRNS